MFLYIDGSRMNLQGEKRPLKIGEDLRKTQRKILVNLSLQNCRKLLIKLETKDCSLNYGDLKSVTGKRSLLTF